MMRVLHVDSGTGWGGGQKQAWLLARAQAERGLAVAVAVPPASPLARRCEAAGLRVLPVSRMQAWNPVAAAALARVARGHRADVVHTHTPKASALAGLCRRLGRLPPHVTTRRTAFAISGPGSRLRARWAYRGGVDGVIAISQAAAEPIRAAGGRPRQLAIVPPAVVVPPTIAPAAPDAGAWPAFLPERLRGHRLAGCVASLVPEKGVDLVLRAWGRLRRRWPEARLVIVGDGPERGALERLAAGVDSGVVFVGWCEEPAVLYPHLELLVHGARNEAVGNVLLEAMVAGTPVVATAVGGVPEVLASGSAGILVPPEDDARLAAAMERLLADPEEARRLGERGRRRVETTYALERAVAAVVGFYEGIAG